MNTYDIVAIRESTRVADDINERGARAVIQRLPTSSCGRYLLIYLMDSPQSTAIERAVVEGDVVGSVVGEFPAECGRVKFLDCRNIFRKSYFRA